MHHASVCLTSKHHEDDDATWSHYRIKEFRMPAGRADDVCLSIGELSRRTAVNIETIRYYERIGLLPPPPRTEGGHRTFGTESYRTLAFIKRSRELGFALEDIRTLLSLRDSQGSCMDVRVVAERHLKDVRTKMQDLMKLESALAETIARCSNDESTDCAVLERLDNGCCRVA
jgi:MerR family mercuric resistance operon transcriptional regulator